MKYSKSPEGVQVFDGSGEKDGIHTPKKRRTLADLSIDELKAKERQAGIEFQRGRGASKRQSKFWDEMHAAYAELHRRGSYPEPLPPTWPNGEQWRQMNLERLRVRQQEIDSWRA